MRNHHLKHSIAMLTLTAITCACSSPPKPPMPTGERIPINVTVRSSTHADKPGSKQEVTIFSPEQENEILQRPANKD